MEPLSKIVSALNERFGTAWQDADFVSFYGGVADKVVAQAEIRTIDGADVCRVHVQPSALPVEAKVSTEKNGQLSKMTAFYVRIGNSTHELSTTEKAKYLLNRWPATSHKV